MDNTKLQSLRSKLNQLQQKGRPKSNAGTNADNSGDHAGIKQSSETPNVTETFLTGELGSQNNTGTQDVLPVVGGSKLVHNENGFTYVNTFILILVIVWLGDLISTLLYHYSEYMY